jgi:hypothetical protein
MTGWANFGASLNPGSSQVYEETMSARAKLDSALMDAKKKRDEDMARSNLRDALRTQMPGASEEQIRSAETMILSGTTNEFSQLQQGIGRAQQTQARQRATEAYAIGKDLDAARHLAVASDNPVEVNRATAYGTYNPYVAGSYEPTEMGRARTTEIEKRAQAAFEQGDLRRRTDPNRPRGSVKAADGVPSADYPPVPAVAQRVAGQVYAFPNGKLMLWTGSGWKPR